MPDHDAPVKIQVDHRADIFTDGMRELDPHYVAACEAMADAARRRNALRPVDRELIALAVNAAVTSMYVPGVRRHTEAALRAGATRLQIIEALELSSVLGIHTLTIALPLLAEVLGVDTEAPLTREQEELGDRFTQARGTPPGPGLQTLLRVDPQFFTAYMAFSGAPWRHSDGLEPKMREFIYVAIDASTTHLLGNGIVGHARKAIHYGATRDELLEVLELTSLIGFHTFVEGVTVLTADE